MPRGELLGSLEHIVLLALVVAVLMVTMSDDVPLWYQLGFLIIRSIRALGGGSLRLRSRTGKASRVV